MEGTLEGQRQGIKWMEDFLKSKEILLYNIHQSGENKETTKGFSVCLLKALCLCALKSALGTPGLTQSRELHNFSKLGRSDDPLLPPLPSCLGLSSVCYKYSPV